MFAVVLGDIEPTHIRESADCTSVSMRYGADWRFSFCLECSRENVVRAVCMPVVQNMLFVHVGYLDDRFEPRAWNVLVTREL